MRGKTSLLLIGATVAWACGASAQTTLRIGLNEDPDILDPTLARTFVGRIVFAGLCDKLFDITADLKVVPQLATEYKWSDDNKTLTLKLRQGVKFHDGETMNAAAVKYSLERHQNMPGSNRKGELSSVASVEAVDDATVALHLSTPYAPLIAQLTDRAGMIVMGFECHVFKSPVRENACPTDCKIILRNCDPVPDDDARVPLIQSGLTRFFHSCSQLLRSIARRLRIVAG